MVKGVCRAHGRAPSDAGGWPSLSSSFLSLSTGAGGPFLRRSWFFGFSASRQGLGLGFEGTYATCRKVRTIKATTGSKARLGLVFMVHRLRVHSPRTSPLGPPGMFRPKVFVYWDQGRGDEIAKIGNCRKTDVSSPLWFLRRCDSMTLESETL